MDVYPNWEIWESRILKKKRVSIVMELSRTGYENKYMNLTIYSMSTLTNTQDPKGKIQHNEPVNFLEKNSGNEFNFWSIFQV